MLRFLFTFRLKIAYLLHPITAKQKCASGILFLRVSRYLYCASMDTKIVRKLTA